MLCLLVYYFHIYVVLQSNIRCLFSLGSKHLWQTTANSQFILQRDIFTFNYYTYSVVITLLLKCGTDIDEKDVTPSHFSPGTEFLHMLLWNKAPICLLHSNATSPFIIENVRNKESAFWRIGNLANSALKDRDLQRRLKNSTDTFLWFESIFVHLNLKYASIFSRFSSRIVLDVQGALGNGDTNFCLILGHHLL